MDLRKNRSHAHEWRMSGVQRPTPSHRSHHVDQVFSEGSQKTVKVSAERVPSFTALSNDHSLEPTKVVLNKHGWNPLVKSYYEPRPDKSIIDNVTHRSILREPNGNDDLHDLYRDSSLRSKDLPLTYNVAGVSGKSVTQHLSQSVSESQRFMPRYNQDNTVSHKAGSSWRDYDQDNTVSHKAGSSWRDYDQDNTVSHKTGSSRRDYAVLDAIPESSFSADSGGRGVSDSTGYQPLFTTSINSERLVKVNDTSYTADGVTRPSNKLAIKVSQVKEEKGKDGLEHVRQIIARQRQAKSNTTDATIVRHRSSKEQTSDFPSSAIKNIDRHSLNDIHRQTYDNGISLSLPNAARPSDDHNLNTYFEMNHRLHQSEDEVRFSNKTKYDQRRTIHIPRKITQAPPAPSYPGFNEVTKAAVPSTVLNKKKLTEPLLTAHTELESGMNKPEERRHISFGLSAESKRKKQPLKDTLPASSTDKHISYQNDKQSINENQKKLSKRKQNDINVRSWRAGIKVINQELGKMPKMSLSPPTKDIGHEDQGSSVDLPSSLPSHLSSQVPDEIPVEEDDETHDDEPHKTLDDDEKAKTVEDDSQHSQSRVGEVNGNLENEIVEKKPAKSKQILVKRKNLKPQEKKEKEKEKKKERNHLHDSEELQRYIAKQKAERKRKEKEEQEERHKAEENRQRQLEELSKKRKESARTRRRSRSRDGSIESQHESSAEESVRENHHKKKIKSSNAEDSDKENYLIKREISEKKDNKETFPPQHVDLQAMINSESIRPSAVTVGRTVAAAADGDASQSRFQRLAFLENSALSLQSRIMAQSHSVANALTVKDGSTSSNFPKTIPSTSVDLSNPVRNVWVPTDSKKVISGPTESILTNDNDDKDYSSDSTLTEDSSDALQNKKPSHRKYQPSASEPQKYPPGADVPAYYQPSASVPTVAISRDQERLASHDKAEKQRVPFDVERWVTKRDRKDSDLESTLTGSNASDGDNDSKASSVDSTFASSIGHSFDHQRETDPPPLASFMYKLWSLQQSHQAKMCSLKLKAQQDAVAATRRLKELENESSRRLRSKLDDCESLSVEKWKINKSVERREGSHSQSVFIDGNQSDSSDISVDQLKDSSRLNRLNKPSSLMDIFPSTGKPSEKSSTIKTAKKRQPTERVATNDLAKHKDDSFDLDSSMTEEEMERSLREVLPSEMQCKKLRRDASLTNVVPLIDHQVAGKHVFDSESFDNFSLNLVRDYLTQEKSRVRHQHAMLELREHALADKTRSELAWLEQQKMMTKKKRGSDDAYPLFKQKQKKILEKHKKQESSIRILQEFAKQSLKMQQNSMSEMENVAIMQMTSKQIKMKLDSRNTKIMKWLEADELTMSLLSPEPEMMSVDSDRAQLKEAAVALEDDISNEDQQNIVEECGASDTSRSQSPQRELRIDADISTDVSHLQTTSPMHEKIAHKLKIQLDKKYLTAREQKLRERREEVERLLAWKIRLDEEEEEILKLEREAAKKIIKKRGVADNLKEDAKTNGASDETAGYEDCSTSPILPIADELNHEYSHVFSTDGQSLPEPPIAKGKPVTTGNAKNIASDKQSTPIDLNAISRRDIDDVDKNAIDKLLTSHDKKTPESQDMRMSDISNQKRGSVSETDESFSVNVSEATSDQSDIERRLKALQEDLKRKKLEAQNLRKRKENKDKLKAKENILKKEIESVNEEILKLSMMSPEKYESVDGAKKEDSKNEITSSMNVNELIKSLSIDKRDTQDNQSIVIPSLGGRVEKARDKSYIPIDTQIRNEVKKSLKNESDDLTSKRRPFDESDNFFDNSSEQRKPFKEIEDEARNHISTYYLEFADSEVDSDKVEKSNVSPKSISLIKSTGSKISPSYEKPLLSKADENLERVEVVSDEEKSISSSIKSIESVKGSSSSSHSKESSSKKQSTRIKDIEKKSSSSSSSATKSYTEDFTSPSKKKAKDNLLVVETDEKQSKADANEKQEEEDDVKTEEEVSTVLSEDISTAEEEEEDKNPELQLDLKRKPDERKKDKSKDSQKFSFSSEDTIAKERLPEFSDPDLQNESADLTIPEIVEEERDVDERSFNGTADSELERVINSAAAAVEEFEKPTEQLTSDPSEIVVDKITDNVINTLVPEAISQVLDIKTSSSAIHESSVDDNQKKTAALSIMEEPSEVFSGSSQVPKLPPLFSTNTKPYSEFETLPLYDNEWSPTADAEWLDDDFGFGYTPAKPPPTTKPPPPPYTEKAPDDLGKSLFPSLQAKVDTIPEPVMVIPHKDDEIVTIVDKIVDIFWHIRRCGESWEDVHPPNDYLEVDVIGGASIELMSRRMHKQLLFDVVAEFLRDIYREEHVEKFPNIVVCRLMPWQQYSKESGPPRTVDVLKPIVRSHVFHLIHLQQELQKVPRKWSSRRKDDGVDRMLVKELHDEEPKWVNYEEDTLKLKLQLAESLFQLLMADTVRTVAEVNRQIQNV